MVIPIGTKEIANKWGVTQATVSKWCRDEKIKAQSRMKKEILGIFLRM